MEPLVLWQHKWSNDLFIPAYLFFGGLTAGVVIVAAVADLLSLKVRRLELLARTAALAAIPLLGLAGFFLTVHLGKPERGLGFPLFFTNYNSWMTRGGWVVGADAPVVLLYGALWYFRVLPRFRRTLAVLAIPVQAFLAMYTGFLLSGAWFVPLWSREFLPLLFLNSGLTTGVAAAGLVLLAAWPFVRRGGGELRPLLRGLGLVLVVLIGVELYELRAFVVHLERRAPDKAAVEVAPSGDFVSPIGSRLAHEYLTGGAESPWQAYHWALVQSAPVQSANRLQKTLAPWFWYGILGIGLLLPLALTLLEFASDLISREVANGIGAVKFACVLVGGFLLRTVIVWGGDLKAPLPFPPSVWPVPGIGLPPVPGLGG
jgi:formate-dependent nitrite reductase membrane component NrfD